MSTSESNIYFSFEMKPNRLKTLRERIEVAKKFDNLHKRPDTADWTWYDYAGRHCVPSTASNKVGDCERNESGPRPDEMNPNAEYIIKR